MGFVILSVVPKKKNVSNIQFISDTFYLYSTYYTYYRHCQKAALQKSVCNWPHHKDNDKTLFGL